MNFTLTWILDKLGYMPKIDMQVGKVNIETKWPFPAPEEKQKPVAKKKPVVKKPAVKKTTRKAK